ncbi:MAG: DNA topoisomerase VI subunit B [Candidatus Diapherotrites archaeon]|uniref:Type 2 DNA topoisomerase 6 subunit B n=1 Tax=Candidatus Iainarchaeum sp. TaxID=3101447 RepID=A0A938YNC6_9ARCH|nr:DNA topoisomerase VI subunit B [Candidatus Diapherotrites archaeon]
MPDGKIIESKIIGAEQIAKEFKEHSVAEFFKKNKQMLGLYGKVRTLTTVIHEYVTNSIDACEESNILPDIDVKIDELGPEYYEVTVKDNGPGLTKETVGKALGQLLAGTKFHRMIQSRGQQGIGASGCTMLSQMTTGKPTKVITGTGKGKPISLELTIDPKLNQPKIANLKEIAKEFRGLAVQAKFKDVMYRDSEQGPLEYLRRTAIANPHVQVKFRDPAGQAFNFKRSASAIPKAPKAVKPHPKGVTIDELVTLAKYTKARNVSSFLRTDFDRMGQKSVEEIAKKISFDLKKDPKQLRWDEAEEIIKAFKTIDFIAPSTDALRPIGEERVKKSLENIVAPEFLHVMTRRPQVYSGGFPFQVEVAIAYGGKAGRTVSGPEGQENRLEIMRFANRAPLLFDAGNCAITKAVHSIDWKRYDIKDIDKAPVTVMVNFISVYVPYTGAGKQAIADLDEVVEEIRLALMQTGRKAGHYISGKRREAEKQLKREIFLKYIPEIVNALNAITKVDKKAMQAKLEKMVMAKLKLEEKKEAEELKKELEKNGNGEEADAEKEKEEGEKLAKKGKESKAKETQKEKKPSEKKKKPE